MEEAIKKIDGVNDAVVSFMTQKMTGYIHGGCSPIGMKKKFVTVYDETIVLFDKILVSGGRVGTQVEVGVEDLLNVTEGKVQAITRNI